MRIGFVVALLAPAPAWALPNINSEDAFLFDFQADTDGSLSNGSIDAYDGCYYVTVNGAMFRAGGIHSDAWAGRGWTSAVTRVGDFDVQRTAFVPSAGGNWARYVDVFTNRAAAVRALTVGVTGNLGSDCGTNTVTTSDGDATVEAADFWAVTDDADLGGDPSLAHVAAGDGAEVGLSAFSVGACDSLSWTYDPIDVGAGETVSFLFFAVQENSRALAQGAAEEVVDLGGAALDEADVEMDTVVNFPIGTGRPIVSIGGPYLVPEEGETFLEPRISDGDGDPLLISWDIDGDGGFDDSSEMNPLFSAAGIDGPDERDIGLYVVEDIAGGEEIIRNATIEIVNVAPTIVSEPPTTARRGGEYLYTPVIADPEPLDTFGVELVADEFPGGMTLDAGTVKWVPQLADVPGPHSVRISVEDDDGGVFEQAWEITVADNTKPYEPSPLYPTLESCVRVLNPTFKVGNAIDPDEDALSYFFEVDLDPGFRSIDHQESPSEGIPEGESGFTEWRVPRPLQDGFTYYWRSWVSDGVEDSEKITNVFDVCAGDADTDADADVDSDADMDVDSDGGSSPGCACGTTGSSPASGLLALLFGLALALRRRRS
jgi:MYXO-CTERM domain-containing protein